jgi:hypothetical protein
VWHRVRSVPIGWPALGVVSVGWLWDGLQLRGGGLFHDQTEAAFSFAALWLVFVLLLIAAWDLFVAIDDNAEDPSVGFGPQRFPNWVRTVLVPAAFVIGIVLGHLFWP